LADADRGHRTGHGRGLLERGIRPDFIPPKYVAESVVEGLLERGVAGKKVLIPRAKVAREVLPEELAKVAAQVDVLPVYETMLTQEDGREIVELLEGRLHYLTFSSSSTVENFFALVPADTLRRSGQGASRSAASAL
jgi:uroporphyrinogen-III synthase (EC 4.2.1.75)/uroporphyrinogen-III C-methyltransferase (EC 2.1.1.107)